MSPPTEGGRMWLFVIACGVLAGLWTLAIALLAR